MHTVTSLLYRKYAKCQFRIINLCHFQRFRCIFENFISSIEIGSPMTPYVNIYTPILSKIAPVIDEITIQRIIITIAGTFSTSIPNAM